MIASDIVKFLEEESKKFSHNPKAPEPKVTKPTPLFKNQPSNSFSIKLLEERLRSKLIEDYKRTQTYSRPYYSVTEITGCLRKSYFSRLKYDVDPAEIYKFPYLYLINQVGNVIHRVIQELYSVSEAEKVIVSEKYKLKGRIDGLLSPTCLLEIKSIDADKFQNLTVPEGHVRQCQIYCFILNNDYGYSVESFELVYVSRCLKKIQSKSFSYNEGIARDLASRAKVLDLAIKNTKPVPEEYCEFEECTFCEYKKYCNVKFVPAEKVNDFQMFDEPIMLL